MISRALFAAAAVLVLAPSFGFAQDAGGRVDEACKAELTSLCADGAGKGGRGFRCLADNQAKLGAACATAVKGAQDRRAALQTACKADGDKLCANSEKGDGKAGEGKGGGGGGLMGCLRAKQAELSKPCADLIATLPAGRGKQ